MMGRVGSQDLLTVRVSIILSPNSWATEANPWRMKRKSPVENQEHPGVGSHRFKGSD